MKTKLLTLLAFCFCSLVSAQDIEEKFVAELATKSRTVASIACNFTETRHMQILTSDIVRDGNFGYKNPAKMALDFKSGDRIVMNGDHFLIRIQGRTNSAKINSNPMMRQLQTILDACMTGNIDRLKLAGKLNIKPIEQSYHVEIVPTSHTAASYVSKIILLFESRDMTLDELRIEQPSGDFTHYRFYEKRLNEPMDETIFQIQ